MTIKAIIFDFDGTLANTLEMYIAIINRLAGEFGYQQTKQADIEHWQSLNSREIIKQSGISIYKIPLLLRRLYKEFQKEQLKVSLFSEIPDVLGELKNRGIQLGIITSNSQQNVETVLKHLEFEDLFTWIYAEMTLFGKHHLLKKLLNNQKLLPQEVIYVGDETRDIEAAKKIKVISVAVSWGFNTRQILAKQNPDFLIDNPQQLLQVIDTLNQ